MYRMTSTPIRHRILNGIAQHAYRYREEPFTLKSGAQSHHYVDCRPVLLNEPFRSDAAHLLHAYVTMTGLHFHAIAGVVLGGVPLAVSLADLTRLPLILVRPESKDHGTQQQVEAAVEAKSGASVLLIEDVVTTGESTIKAVRALRSEGYHIAKAVALVDRQYGAGEALAEENVQFRAFYTLEQIIHTDYELFGD